MSRLFKLLVLFVVCCGLSGCLDITQTYTINPDGSGKVVHEAILPQMNMSMDGSASKPSADKLKKTVLEEIKKAKGIDAWRDISYEQRGDDQIFFKGTAYFKDINKVKFHNSGASINVYDSVSLRQENGQMVVAIHSSHDEDKDKADDEMSAITEENVDAEITKLQGEYQKTRMMAAGIFSGIKLRRTFYLPGEISSSSNVELADDGAVQSNFEGSKLLDFMDVMMNDTELLRKELLSGHNPLKGGGPTDELKINEFIFGEAAPVQAIVTVGSQTQFNYAVEVARAEKDFEPTAKDLGAPAKAVLKGPEGSHFKVAGVRIVNDSDMDNNLRPFNYDEGYTLSIVGRLPEEVLSVTEGQLLAAQTDHGQDLLPSDEWKQKISFPRLSEDKRKVIFEVDLRRPAQSAKGIAEVSGVLTYLVAENARRVDLNITTFAAGTEGSDFGAAIESVKDSEWNPGKQELKLKVSLNKDTVKVVDIFDAAGNKLEVSQGYMSSGDTTTFSYTLQDGGEFPENGRIEIEVYEDLKKYELPFKITGISLLGRKLN